MKEVAVIGSGLGGMVAALSLALKGFKVSIYEQDLKLGGYAGEFVRKKGEFSFNFDISLHHIGDLKANRRFAKQLKSLGIYDELSLVLKPNLGLFIHGEKKVQIPANAALFYKLLNSIAPDEKEGLLKLFSFLKDFDGKMQAEKDHLESMFWLLDLTLEEFLSLFLKDEFIKELFASLWTYFGCVKEKMNAFFYLVAFNSFFYGGCFYIKGGSKSLVAVLEGLLLKHGVRIFKNTKILKLVVKNEQVKAAETAFSCIKADYFVINACMYKDLGLLQPKSTLSFTSLYLGLYKSAKSLGVEESIFKRYELSQKKELEAIKKGEYGKMSFSLTAYPSEQGGVLVLTMADLHSNWPSYKSKEYKEKKAKIKQIMLEKLLEIYPFLKDEIALSCLATPHTLEFFTKNPKGAVYGYNQSLENAGFKRVGLKAAKNAFLASAWTMPGGGYEGVMNAGLSSAKALFEFANLKQASFLPPKVFLNALLMQASPSKDFKGCLCFDLEGEGCYEISFNSKVSLKTLKNLKSFDLTAKNLKQNTLYVSCSNETLQLLCSGEISPETLLKCKLITLRGDIKNFEKMKELFIKGQVNLSLFDSFYKAFLEHRKKLCFLSNESFLKQRVKDLGVLRQKYALLLSLLPFISYWFLSSFISVDKVVFFYLTLFYSLFLLPFFTGFVSTLDKTAVLAFCINAFFSQLLASFILPLAFLVQVLLKQPISLEYSKIAKGRLYFKIHSIISLVFGLNFLAQSLVLCFYPSFFYIYLLNFLPFVFKHCYLSFLGFKTFKFF